MSKLLLEHLDTALDDVQMSHVHNDNINACVDKVLDYKNKIKDAEKELVECIDQLCAELSTEIRRLQPNLTVSMKTGVCEVCYRTRILTCCAKPYDGCWNFDGNDFGCMFSKRYPECKKLSCHIPDLASCIVEYFNNHYRSLA